MELNTYYEYNKSMSESNDPVLEVMRELEKTTPVRLAPIIVGYVENGVDGIEEAWNNIIKDIANED